MIIEKAPGDTLKDTPDAINRFVCFENRRKQTQQCPVYHYFIPNQPVVL